MLAAGSECRYILHLPMSSASVRKNLREFLWRDDFELRVGAVCWFLVRAPAAELGGVAGAVALHVVVCNLHYELRTQRFPGQVLALTPAALATGHALNLPVAS